MAKRKVAGSELSADEKIALAETGLQTMMIREHQDQILALAAKRRVRVQFLRDRGVTFVKIAEAMGTSENAAYKVLG
jgi:hypothetical protein